jgi:hypothetical protein
MGKVKLRIDKALVVALVLEHKDFEFFQRFGGYVVAANLGRSRSPVGLGGEFIIQS